MLNNSVNIDTHFSKLGSAQHCHTSNQTKKNQLNWLNDLQEITKHFSPTYVNLITNLCFSIGLNNSNVELE